MTEDGKWLEEQFNTAQPLVDLGDHTYGVDRETINGDMAGLTLVSNGATVQRVDASKGRKKGSGRVFNFTGDHLTIRGSLKLVGPMGEDDFVKRGGSEGSGVEGEHGIGIMGVVGFLLDGLRIRDFYGDGIFLGSRGGSLNARGNANGVINNVQVWNTGRHSLTLTSIDGLRITGKTRLEYARRMPIDKEKVHTKVDLLRGIVVDDDTVRCNRAAILNGRC